VGSDTEEDTGSNPVAPTNILPAHSVAGAEPVSLTSWLGRAGAARPSSPPNSLVLSSPPTRASGSTTTTYSSRGTGQAGSPRGAVRQPRTPPTPLPSPQPPAIGAPRGGLASLAGRAAASRPSTTPASPWPTPRWPPLDLRDGAASWPTQAHQPPPGDGAGPPGTRLVPVVTLVPPDRRVPHPHHPTDVGPDGCDRAQGRTPDGWTPDGLDTGRPDSRIRTREQMTGHWTGWTPDGWTLGPRTAERVEWTPNWWTQARRWTP
jgi:hypothetical protein